jgi:hypothetical protein
MTKRTKPTTDALAILHRRHYAGKAARLRNLDETRANEEIACKIYELRTAAWRSGLCQFGGPLKGRIYASRRAILGSTRIALRAGK